MKLCFPLRLCAFACLFFSHAYAGDTLIYDDRVFFSSIHTVLLYPEGRPREFPILRLGTPEQLVLSFDELDGESRSLHYTLIHCNASWDSSGLPAQEYLEGFAESEIRDVQNSFNTSQAYVHYSVRIPGEQKILLSGNYIVQVYEGEPGNVLLTARMMVSEDNVALEGRVHQATGIEEKKYRQEVDFSITYDPLTVLNPFDDLQVCIFQNKRKDNAICDMKPRYVRNNLLDYDYDDVNVFDGGSEFRQFDARSFRAPGERIVRTRMDTGGYHLFVEKDLKRSYLRYTFDKDLNGGFLVQTKDGNNDSLEADYVWVHLELAAEEPYAEGQLYVLGNFCHWNYDSASLMRYDAATRSYRVQLYLKQGYYNYCYILRPEGLAKGETSVVEGDHYETENDYLVCVYSRPTGSRYDRLVAAYSMNSLTGK